MIPKIANKLKKKSNKYISACVDADLYLYQARATFWLLPYPTRMRNWRGDARFIFHTDQSRSSSAGVRQPGNCAQGILNTQRQTLMLTGWDYERGHHGEMALAWWRESRWNRWRRLCLVLWRLRRCGSSRVGGWGLDGMRIRVRLCIYILMSVLGLGGLIWVARESVIFGAGLQGSGSGDGFPSPSQPRWGFFFYQLDPRGE